MPSLLCSSCCRHLQQALFNLCQQRRFTYTGWPEDEDQTSPGRFTQRIPDGLICLFERRMSDGVRLEVVQSALGWLMQELARKRNRNALFTHHRYSS